MANVVTTIQTGLAAASAPPIYSLILNRRPTIQRLLELMRSSSLLSGDILTSFLECEERILECEQRSQENLSGELLAKAKRNCADALCYLIEYVLKPISKREMDNPSNRMQLDRFLLEVNVLIEDQLPEGSDVETYIKRTIADIRRLSAVFKKTAKEAAKARQQISHIYATGRQIDQTIEESKADFIEQDRTVNECLRASAAAGEQRMIELNSSLSQMDQTLRDLALEAQETAGKMDKSDLAVQQLKAKSIQVLRQVEED